MKKIMFSIIALVGMISFASCKKELQEIKQEEQVSPETVQLSITASIPESKTLIAIENNAYVPKWVNGDKLGVFIGNFDANATAVSAELSGTTNDGGETATFKGSAPQAMGPNTVYAFYPARAFYATEADNVVDLEIPYIQFPTEQSFDPKADLLVSVPQEISIVAGENTVDNMQFRRIGAILKVDLVDGTSLLASDKIKSVKLESKAPGTALTGAFRYDFTNEDAASEQITAAKSHVTADFSLNPIAWGTSVYFIVNPTTLESGTELVVTVLTDNHSVEKAVTLPGKMVFECSAVKRIKVTFDDASAVERVYFQDNFDWIYKYWDEVYGNAYGKNHVGLDPVATGANDAQPNIWSTYALSFGNAFTSIGYLDLEHSAGEKRNVLYAQENYLKMCKNNNQTGIELPALSLGEIPVNVTLSFDIALNDKKNFVVEVLGRGICADSGVSVSNTFTYSEAFSWNTKQLTLIGLTNSSRICIRPAVESFATSGYYRFWVDNIKVTEANQTPAVFPIVWSFPAPSDDTWKSGVDYLAKEGGVSGSYVYSDGHQGKLTVIRPSSTTTTNTNYRKNDLEDYHDYTLLHYGMNKDSYWLFEVYNVGIVV